MSLSRSMVEVLTWMEQVFWEDGKVPTNEAIAEAINVRVETIRTYWEHEEFRIAAAARGIDSNNVLAVNPRALTMEQLLVANLLLNVHDRRSMREKLKDGAISSLNISPQKVAAWMRQPAFQDHLRKRALETFKGAEPLAYRELVRAIESGDMKAVQLYFEMTGIYNPRLQVDVNINVVISRVVEIIQRHVQDPVILAAIAEDVEALEIGSAPGAVTPNHMPLSALRL